MPSRRSAFSRDLLAWPTRRGVRSAHLTAVSAVTWLGASAVHVNERYRVEKIDDNCGASPSVGNQLLVSLRLFFNRYTSVTSSCHDQAKATDLLDIRIGEWCVADTRTMICLGRSLWRALVETCPNYFQSCDRGA